MIDQLHKLHSKLSHEDCVRIVLSVKGWEIMCDKTDILRFVEDLIIIVRKSGRTVVIDSNEIIMMCTMSKRSVLL